MPEEVFVPKTGIYLDDVLLIEWTVEEGAYVNAGDVLFRMETNKVEEEVEAEASGYVHQKGVPGSEYAIGAVIGWIAENDHAYRQLVESGGPS